MPATGARDAAGRGARAALALLAACAWLAGCGGDAPAPPAAAPDPATLPGTWTGTYPCAGCPGIDTTLWLRRDRRYFLEQRYRPGADGETAAATHSLGRWEWRAAERVLALAGAGPVRVFQRPEAGRLVFVTAVPEPHVLVRRDDATDFTGVLAVDGVVRRAGDGYVLTECLTGYAVPLGAGSEYTRFTRQFRSVVPRGAAGAVRFEGRYDWNADGTPASFGIERFVTLRAGGACSRETP